MWVKANVNVFDKRALRISERLTFPRDALPLHLRPIFSLLFAVERGERKFVDRMTVVLGVFPSYHRVVAVDPYRPVVMRDREGKDLPVDLILAFNSTEELDVPRTVRVIL